MQANPTHHSSPDVLRALGAGQLDAATAAAVIAHLDGCVECRQMGGTLLGAGLVERLRVARSPTGTVVEALTPADTSRAVPSPVQATTAPNVAPGILPELRDHPQYEVIRELGRGGMGVVYLVRNKLMDRPEVLKVVNQQLLGNAQSAERFLREIRSAARLSHANIVTAYSALQAGELLAFAMEYVEGEDLGKVVRTQGRLPVANACYYTLQVALGLQHAFEKGLVHRDIKPQNMILARVGKKHIVKILDFGLAKATREGEEADRGLTGTGMMIGTPDFIAPEQTLDAAKADIRADIYSLGCSLYYLLTASPPFQAKSQYEVLHAHHMKEAKPLDLVRNDVPVELAVVAAKMMAKDPARRYQQPGEVAQALTPFAKAGLKKLAAAPVSPAPVVTVKTVIENHPSSVPAAWVLPADPEPADSARAGKKTSEPAPMVQDKVVEGSATINRWAKPTTAKAMRPSRQRWDNEEDEGAQSALRRIGPLIIAALAILVMVGILGGLTFAIIRGHSGSNVALIQGDRSKDTKDATDEHLTGRSSAELDPKYLPGGLAIDPMKEREEEFSWYQEGKAGTGKRGVIVLDLGGGQKMEFVRIKSGDFWMGSPDDEKDAPDAEKPRHQVKITKDFYLAKYTVTRGQFRQFVNDVGYKTEAEADGKGAWGVDAETGKFAQDPKCTWRSPGFEQDDNHPVVNVSWNDAHKFVGWLRKKGGKQVRLPSEAEWEYACRAGSTTKYYCGDDKEELAKVGNVADASFRQKFAKLVEENEYYKKNPPLRADDGYVFTAPVGKFKANKFGVHDMHGNVWQWCQDCYSGVYYKECAKEGTIKDPIGPQSEQTYRMLRGGAWGDSPRFCRCACRDGGVPASRSGSVGFRVLLPLD